MRPALRARQTVWRAPPPAAPGSPRPPACDRASVAAASGMPLRHVPAARAASGQPGARSRPRPAARAPRPALALMSAAAGPRLRRCGSSSGVEIRDQLALQACDLILEHELALLQALQLQLIHVQIKRQAGDDLIEITMFDAQLTQFLHVAEQFAVDVVFDFRHTATAHDLREWALDGLGLLAAAAKGLSLAQAAPRVPRRHGSRPKPCRPVASATPSAGRAARGRPLVAARAAAARAAAARAA